MRFELAPLPYAKDALEPYIGAETLELHHEKHHRGYLEKLRRAIEGKPEAKRRLVEIVRNASGDVFDHAAQVWNHAFYWMSMKPGGGGEPEPALRGMLAESFGGYAGFCCALADAANGVFGSGWAWLVAEPRTSRLRVVGSSDAQNPLTLGLVPLATLDVWEHAYYLDYRNERDRYVEAFLDHLLNWDFVAANLALAPEAYEPGWPSDPAS